MTDKGFLMVVSGPSGVGKDAVLEHLGKIFDGYQRCVTATTRAQRPHETDGVDYYFLTMDEFRARVESGRFLEYANVHGKNMYGTPLDGVEAQLEKGGAVLLKIDVQGGASVKKRMPEAVMVFLSPPSMEELERRLRNRSTETEEEITRRTLDARNEMAQAAHYDYVIVNDTIESAAEKLKAVIIAEKCRVRR